MLARGVPLSFQETQIPAELNVETAKVNPVTAQHFETYQRDANDVKHCLIASNPIAVFCFDPFCAGNFRFTFAQLLASEQLEMSEFDHPSLWLEW